MSDEDLMFFIRHSKHALRQGAAGKIYKEKRFQMIPELLNDKDARVRWVGLSGMQMPRVSSRPERCDPGFPQDKVSDEMLKRMFEMLNDPEESWFVVDSVLQRLSLRSAEELAPHIDRISQFPGTQRVVDKAFRSPCNDSRWLSISLPHKKAMFSHD